MKLNLFRRDPNRFPGGSQLKAKVASAAIHTYWHAELGRTITTVGTWHHGEQSFYAAVSKAIDKCEAAGAVVIYEGLMIDQTQRNLTEAERPALERTLRSHPIGEQAYLEALGLNWVLQKDELVPGGKWRHADAAGVDVLRLTGKTHQAAGGASQPTADWQAAIDRVAALTPKQRKRARWVYFVQVRSEALGQRPFRMSKQAWAIRHEVDGIHRGCIAASAALRIVLDEHRDAVMVYGAMHLEYIDKILRRNGFTLTETEWVPIARLAG